MLAAGSKGEKIFIYGAVIIAIIVLLLIINANTGFISKMLRDPIVGDWECITSATHNKPTGVGYHFYDNGSYTLYQILAGENSDYSSGTWTRINDGYYKIYNKYGKVDGYLTYDNGWLYQDNYALHRVGN